MKSILFRLLFILPITFFVSCDDDASFGGSLPDYWEKEINARMMEVNACVNDCGGDCTSFVFFTDSHWGMNARRTPLVIKGINSLRSSDYVLFGGDWVTDVDTNKVAMLDLCREYQSSFSFLDAKLLSVYGNHDANGNQQKKVSARFTKEEVYGYLQSNLNRDEVKYGDYFYYYHDDPTQKTRYICLDDGEFDMSVTQYRFLVEALNSLPDNWFVVVSIHILKRGVSGQPGSYYHPLYVVNMTSVLDAFQTRSRGTIVVGGYTIPFDYETTTGRVLCCVGGHVHNDNVSYSGAGIPCIVFDSDASGCSESAFPKSHGTVNEQCITYIVADHNSSKISCIRFGRGINFTISQ